MVQVKNALHYSFANYLGLERWNSYWHQISETLDLQPNNVLIIGKGDGFVGNFLSQFQINVTSFDFDKALNPDIIGDVVDIEDVIKNKEFGKFDLLLCCQVLEHLPFDNFENILEQFSKITNNIIISLPYKPVRFRLSIKVPYIKEQSIKLIIHHFFRRFKYNDRDGHYWEMAYKGYSTEQIKKILSTHFTIKKSFEAKHNQYHYFFIMENKIKLV